MPDARCSSLKWLSPTRCLPPNLEWLSQVVPLT